MNLPIKLFKLSVNNQREPKMMFHIYNLNAELLALFLQIINRFIECMCRLPICVCVPLRSLNVK